MQESSLQIEPLELEHFDLWKSDLKNRWANLRSESGKVTSNEAMATVIRIIDKRLPDELKTAGHFSMISF